MLKRTLELALQDIFPMLLENPTQIQLLSFPLVGMMNSVFPSFRCPWHLLHLLPRTESLSPQTNPFLPMASIRTMPRITHWGLLLGRKRCKFLSIWPIKLNIGVVIYVAILTVIFFLVIFILVLGQDKVLFSIRRWGGVTFNKNASRDDLGCSNRRGPIWPVMIFPRSCASYFRKV